MITSNFRQTPAGTPGAIAISRSVPRYRKYARYPELKPGKDWFRSAPEDEYVRLYGEILAGLDAQTVWDELHELADGAEPILLCFEAPGEFCHRRIVAKWFERELGVNVSEGKYDAALGKCVANEMQIAIAV
ncbi:MAG: DUF488 family protein [Cyanobacteria bacterium J06648_11]